MAVSLTVQRNGHIELLWGGGQNDNLVFMSYGLAGTKFLNPLFQTTESLNGHTEVSSIGNAKFP